MNDNLQSVIRAILTSLGGALVANGYVTSAQLQSAIGAAIALAAVAWSVYSNHQTRAANAVAAVTGSPVVVPLIGVPTVADHAPAPKGPAAVAAAKAA